MNAKTFQYMLLAMLFPFSACLTAHAADKNNGFVRIFDGETLKGWETMPVKTSKVWTVKDGMLVGDGDKGRDYLVFENKDSSSSLSLYIRIRNIGLFIQQTLILAIRGRARNY